MAAGEVAGGMAVEVALCQKKAAIFAYGNSSTSEPGGNQLTFGKLILFLFKRQMTFPFLL